MKPQDFLIKYITFLAVFLIIILSLMFFPSIHASSNISQPSKNTTNTATTNKLPPAVIGILLPMEHEALMQMISGFKESIQQNSKIPVVIKVQNAQSDIKLQRSILECFKGQNVDIIVTIGTSTSQMALSIIDQQPIVTLAALLSKKEVAMQSHHLTGIIDEISGEKKLQFLKKVFPHLKKFTILYHSGNEKNYPEAKEIVALGEKMNIQAQTLSIQNLSDLTLTAQSISKDSELILILKDHLLASGATLLNIIANTRKIPFIASDESSVMAGAAFALGVSEKQIGEEGGKIVAKLLLGENINQLPMKQLETFTIFYNKKEMSKNNISINSLEKVADELKYTVKEIK